jgi:hypothetical protein
MDYEYQDKTKEIYRLKYVYSLQYTVVLKISIRYHKIFLVCEYQLWQPYQSDAALEHCLKYLKVWILKNGHLYSKT